MNHSISFVSDVYTTQRRSFEIQATSFAHDLPMDDHQDKAKNPFWYNHRFQPDASVDSLFLADGADVHLALHWTQYTILQLQP